METIHLKTAGGQTQEHSKHIPQDQNETVVLYCGRQHTKVNWEATLPNWYKLSGLGPLVKNRTSSAELQVNSSTAFPVPSQPQGRATAISTARER